jgi:hypothetical protein
MVAFQGGHPHFKGNSPHLRPHPSRAKSSPTRSKVLPLRHGGWAPRVMQAGQGQKKPNRRARGTCNWPAVTSNPPLSPGPAGERADRHAGGMQPHRRGATFRLRRVQHGGPGPPEATLRMTQQCQPGTSVTGQSAAGEGATVDTARSVPAVMAVAGERKQRSSRQPSSCPLLGQRESPLPRREDGAPVFCSSNDSRTRNGCPGEPLVPSH